MAAWTVCPGCRAHLPATGWAPPRGLDASGECWQVHGEVVGFEIANVELVRRFHQLTVDAYGAQHAGTAHSPLRTAYSLVGLHLALDRGVPGIEVRTAHQRMGRPDPSWPAFARPEQTGELTIVDVAEAGVMLGSVEGHAELAQRWADAVWRAWAPQHAAVAALSERLLGRSGATGEPRLRDPGGRGEQTA